MRAVIQRVNGATIVIDSSTIRSIRRGFVVLVGIEVDDTQQDVEWLAQKIVNMRIFSDREGKMNLGLNEIKGDLLLVSQFTLFASTKKGNRPSFLRSAKPDTAIPLYEACINEIKKSLSSEQNLVTGEFGSDMQITLTNDGPVTILVDTKAKE